MKLKRGDWTLILVVVVVLALVWYSGGFREMFDPSQQSFAKGSPPNCPSGATAQPDGTCAGACPSGATQSTSSNGFIICKTSTSNGGFSSGPAPTVPAVSCSGGGVLFQGGCYQSCGTGLTLQNVPRMGVMCVPGSSASSTPAPAASSSTQPMTLPVPSPCRPEYKSIPGGTMEFKCFD